MRRAQKEQIIKDIQQKIESSQGLFFFDYQGLRVASMTELRRGFHKGRGELKIYKNTLMRRALKGTETEKVVSDVFKGPVACVFSYEDPVPVAKTLLDFEIDEKKLNIKTGVLQGKKVSLEDIKQLAKLPPREVLLAQWVGTLAAPIRALVTVLSAVPRDFVYVLKAIEQKKSKE